MWPLRKTPSAQPGTSGLSYGRKTASMALRWARSSVDAVRGDWAPATAATPDTMNASKNDLDTAPTTQGGGRRHGRRDTDGSQGSYCSSTSTIRDLRGSAGSTGRGLGPPSITARAA